MGFPGCIVARGVRAVKLITLHSVPACVHERYSEGATAAHLSVDVLLVSKVADELLAVDRCSLTVNVPLAVQAAHIDQLVCVSDNA